MATLDTKFEFSNATPVSDDPTQINKADEYKRQATKRGAAKHRWLWDLQLRPHQYATAMEFYAFIVAQGGRGGIWNLPNPLPQMGTGPGGETRAIIPKGATSVPLGQLGINNTGIMQPGDFIQFADHPKAYMVQNIVNSNSSQQGTATVYPPLFKQVASGVDVKFGDLVLFQVSLESDAADIQIAARQSNMGEPRIDVAEVG